MPKLKQSVGLMLPKTEVKGRLLSSIKVDKATCGQQCQDNAECVAFSYCADEMVDCSQKTKKCWLYDDEIYGLVLDSGVHTVFKGTASSYSCSKRIYIC